MRVARDAASGFSRRLNPTKPGGFIGINHRRAVELKLKAAAPHWTKSGRRDQHSLRTSSLPELGIRFLTMIAIGFVASLTQGSDSSAEDTWRGLDVAPEHRCSPYDHRDYRYPQSVEPRIVAELGQIYGLSGVSAHWTEWCD